MAQFERASRSGDVASIVPSTAPQTHTFAALYDAHVHEVYRFIHRRCRDHALAEDITQETFIAALRNTDDPSSITIGWLITVARNRLVDVLRRQVSFESKLKLLRAGHSTGEVIDLADRLRVEEALGKVRVDHRLVLTLHYMDGYTVPAMAELLGKTVKSVEAMVTRARRELRSHLEDGDVEIGDSNDR